MKGAVMLAAAGRSSGKTMVAAGLAAALARRGLAVQCFKKGPDSIDPQWLSAASGRPARNLDPRLQGMDGAAGYWARHAAAADVALVEANQGLHDGLDAGGGDSNAALAKRLGLPVVLVLDVKGVGRTAAAVAMGLALFDPEVRIAGVILNRVGGARHEARLRESIEERARLPVLGALPDDPRMGVAERHLGLVPAGETPHAAAAVEGLAETVAAHVDLDAVLAAASSAMPVVAPAPVAPVRRAAGGPRIGIARDRAFGFYYADDLEGLERAGAVLVPFDTLHDTRLPPVDALFLGGGFPEMFGAEIEANAALRSQVRRAIEAGMPAYAECGGLMYLARTLEHRGRRWSMVGAIPADVQMRAKPVGKGYVTLEETADHPWPGRPGGPVEAHEFHYSAVVGADPGLRHAYRVVRGHGIDGERDGILHRNVLAAYAHLRSVEGHDWPARFVAHVIEVNSRRDARAA